MNLPEQERGLGWWLDGQLTGLGEEKPIEGKAEAEQHLYAFMRQAWHVIEPATPFVPGWHIECLCEHLEAIEAGQIQNLLIMVPPGSTKSISTAVMWPAWAWIKRPASRWLFASYSLGLAERDREKCALLIRSDWYQTRWGRRFRLTTDAKTFLTNDKTGKQGAMSVRAGTTGFKGDRLLIDDAHNIQEVESEVIREGTLRWHDQSWWNRVNDFEKSARVVIGQRTHMNDLLGHLEKQGGYEILRLPEEYHGSSKTWSMSRLQDPRTQEGELLRPERFTEEHVRQAKLKLGPYGYAAQHDQNPVPREGALIQRQWFRRYAEDVDAFKLSQLLGGDVLLKADCWSFCIIDPAKSKKRKADYTSIGTYTVMYHRGRRKLLIRDMVNERLGHEGIVPRLDEVCADWGPHWVGIEADGFQVFVCDEARRFEPSWAGGYKKKWEHVPTIMELETHGKGKIQRATPMIIQFRQGDILLPTQGALGYEYPWLEVLETQLTTVTGFDDEHDDIWDNVAWAVLALDQFKTTAETGEPFVAGTRPQRVGVDF